MTQSLTPGTDDSSDAPSERAARIVNPDGTAQAVNLPGPRSVASSQSSDPDTAGQHEDADQISVEQHKQISAELLEWRGMRRAMVQKKVPPDDVDDVVFKAEVRIYKARIKPGFTYTAEDGGKAFSARCTKLEIASYCRTKEKAKLREPDARKTSDRHVEPAKTAPRDREVSLESVPEASSGDAPMEALLGREQAMAILKEFVPDAQQRRIYLMHFYYGHRKGEIAEALGLSRWTVRNRLNETQALLDKAPLDRLE
jgi:DNA-directed RNA polymerase specialized sigma24 family protein